MTDPWNTDAPLDLYLRRASRAGIRHTVVFPAFNSDYASANARLAQLIRRYPGRLTGFAFVHCSRDGGRIQAMVEQAVGDWKFRGIKVHAADAPSRAKSAKRHAGCESPCWWTSLATPPQWR